MNIEDRIVELCERAHAKGWKFCEYQEPPCTTSCGCVLEACAVELGVCSWEYVGDELGISDVYSFGVGFDRETLRQSESHYFDVNESHKLGKRVALRLRERGLMS